MFCARLADHLGQAMFGNVSKNALFLLSRPRQSRRRRVIPSPDHPQARLFARRSPLPGAVNSLL
jgi:hypothetical protein